QRRLSGLYPPPQHYPVLDGGPNAGQTVGVTLPPGFTLLQVVPRLDAGGVERTTLDIDAAVAAAGGRSLVASAGGRMEGQLKGDLIRMPVDSKSPSVLIANRKRLKTLIRQEDVSLVHA